MEASLTRSQPINIPIKRDALPSTITRLFGYPDNINTVFKTDEELEQEAIFELAETTAEMIENKQHYFIR